MTCIIEVGSPLYVLLCIICFSSFCLRVHCSLDLNLKVPVYFYAFSFMHQIL